MKELALIALLGGAELDCGDIILAKDSVFFVDTACHMTADGYGICHIIDDPDNQGYPAKLTLVETNGKLLISINDNHVGTCN